MRKKICSALLGIALLAGCQEPQPPATPLPPAPAATGYGDASATSSAPGTAGAAQRFDPSLDVPGQWWKLFHSDELSGFVTESIAANPDIAAAQAALRSARETLLAQRASTYPNAQGSLSISRQQLPTYYAPPLNANANEYVYGLHTISLDVAYTPDVFGNLRYQTATSAAGVKIARFATEATYLTLTSNVVVTVMQDAALRAQIASTRRLIEINRKLLDLIKTQRAGGTAAGTDVATQEAAVAAFEQQLPPLERSLAQTRDLLARLVGRSPDTMHEPLIDLDAFALPEALPLTLPAKLVNQRPDIAAAEANLEAASAQVGVAYTNRLPNFSITSQTATQALTLGTLFNAQSFLSVLTGAVAQTFYDHGTLKHREAAAVAAYDEAAATYTGSVLTGLQNVADTLAALKTDADALRAATDADAAARRTLAIVQAQRSAGAVTDVAVLTAEQGVEQSHLALIGARANRFMDSAALFESLGGGWWNRSETSP